MKNILNPSKSTLVSAMLKKLQPFQGRQLLITNNGTILSTTRS
jgi:hypothetical protein